jgi:hypothetical protein
MTNAEILKSALRQIHFRSDFNIGGEWEEALDGLIAELEQAKRDALPCQVLDVLEANRKLETNLRIQVEYATNLEKENRAWETQVAEIENENRILKNEVDDLRSFAKIHTDHAKRTLGLPVAPDLTNEDRASYLSIRE